MCHGSDGRGGEGAPNIATSHEIQDLPDSELIHIVHDGIPNAGMPSFASLGLPQVESVVAYLRILQGKSNSVSRLPGDPHAGQMLFYGKASCSTCHMVNGSGGFIGGDLTTFSQGLLVSQVTEAITQPDRDLEPGSEVVHVVMRSGKTITGMIRNEDNFVIGLQSADGSFYFLQRSGVERVDHTSHSLMPRDYGSTLSSTELNDLVSFLLNVRRDDPKTASGAN
jgi:cytochrome c oxidase cbb3-type subunit III